MRIAFVQKTTDRIVALVKICTLLKTHGHTCRVFCMDLERDLAKSVIGFKPHIVGFNCLSCNYGIFLKEAMRIKRRDSNILVVFGGVHPTFCPDIIDEESIDVICRGEGEFAMLELADYLEQHRCISDIKNLYIKSNGRIFKNDPRPLVDNLDALPFADFGPYDHYAPIRRDNLVYCMTSRGCPYSCTYCCNYKLRDLYKGSTYIRRQSVKYTIEEMEYMIRRHPEVKYISFADDIFTLHKDWLIQFLEMYRARIGLKFICNIHVNAIDEEIIRTLKGAGCDRVCFGIEHGDPGIRTRILNRNYSNDRILEVAALLKKNRIRIRTYNMIGVPSEKLTDALRTVEINAVIRPEYACSYLMIPYPGTQIYEMCLRDNLLKNNFSFNELKGHESESLSSPITLTDDRLIVIQKFFDLLVKYPKLWRHAIKISKPRKIFNIFYYYPNLVRALRYDAWHAKFRAVKKFFANAL